MVDEDLSIPILCFLRLSIYLLMLSGSLHFSNLNCLYKKLTQKQLGEIIGKAESTIRIYENGGIEIPNNILTEIGKALGVFFFKFTYDDNYSENTVKKDTTYFLEQKLTQIGYSIGGIEEEGYLWINYPDGTLEVKETDLKEFMRAVAHI